MFLRVGLGGPPPSGLRGLSAYLLEAWRERTRVYSFMNIHFECKFVCALLLSYVLCTYVRDKLIPANCFTADECYSIQTFSWPFVQVAPEKDIRKTQHKL